MSNGRRRPGKNDLSAMLPELQAMFPTIGGRNVNEYAGGFEVHTDQIGFAAELTGPWDAKNGYPWKRLTLDCVATPPAVINQIGVQQTGNQAVEVSSDTTLAAGVRVWLEPSPDSSGYLFRKPAGAAGGGLGVADLTEATGAASWNGRVVSSGGTWANSGTTGTDNAWPVQCGGAALTPKPTATTLMWPSATAGFYEFFPVQYADLVSGTYYAGLLSTGVQTVGGSKTWAALAQFQDGTITTKGSSSVSINYELAPVGPVGTPYGMILTMPTIGYRARLSLHVGSVTLS